MVGHEEVLLLRGYSASVQAFVRGAQRRKPRVLLAEGGLVALGHTAAEALASRHVTVVADAGIAAVAHRAHKVVIGARAVCADGSVVADAGSSLLVAAARAAALPVLVVASGIKIAPRGVAAADVAARYATHPAAYAGDVISRSLADEVGAVDIIAPVVEVLPAADISLLVTNLGVFPPSAVARHAQELYG